MTSKFEFKHDVPKDFPQIMTNFAREVLRNQPVDIYKFGAEYFEQKLNEKVAESATPAPAPTTHVTPVEAPAEAEEIDIDLNDPQVAEAANKIQGAFRRSKLKSREKQ